ncbi:hypothetical protein HNQ09_002150 [Deinococcus budaensis]|uniref:LiaF transmembrane domain-containing protein n=1 Tax=Deinococcus budaensis TaxID=1665626 RepID=A0A7W8GFH8_9DEIO|nr:DUF5668 domain-containing protein [Deinococcus budaensis]MBB5234707.1 hypothetical protein [Deinococcus budaensis]
MSDPVASGAGGGLGRRPPSLVGPLVLIALGLLFLLTNLGVLSPGVWDTLWRLWPFALIAVGVEVLVGRRTRWGGLAVLGVFAVAAVVGVWWSVRTPAGAALTDQPVRVAVPAGVHRAELTLRSGVSQLALRAGNRGDLVSGQVQIARNERLTNESSQRGGTAVVQVAVSGSSSGSFTGQNTPRWTLALAPTLPWTLNVSTGVGRADLDLRNLRVTDLTLAGGVGETTVTLPARGETRADIRSGVGALTVRLPAGLAARVVANAGLGAVQVTLPVTRDGDTSVIGDPGTNPNRAEVRVNGGVGRVLIERAP